MTSSRIKSNLFSSRIYWKEVLAVFVLLLAIFFFRNERKELQSIVPHIRQANLSWILAAFFLTVCSFFFQGGMYRKSFAAMGLLLKWDHSITLYLKRSFISTFLPAGSLSSLAYSPSEIRKAGFTKIQVHQASAFYWFAGMLTVFLIGVPIIIFSLSGSGHFKNAWIGLLLILVILAVLFITARFLRNKGKLYQWIEKKRPSLIPTINELFAANVNTKQVSGVVLYSLGIELCGILHVYIAMLALGLPASPGVSAFAYVIAVVMTVLSPFLKGLGAVELSMAYILTQFDYSPVASLAITVLYRVFEFWLPLLAGFIAFSWKGRKLFLRLAPALLTFILGIVNIISAVTPPIHQRLHLLKEYIPLTIIHGSYLLVLFVGLSLLLTAAFLFRGLRNAWTIALALSLFSLIGHLTKAFDYEEAIIAALTVAVLIITAGQYRMRSSNKWMQAGLTTAGLSFAAVLVFGFISFYFIDVKHFGVDFTWQQSLLHTVKIFLLAEDSSLHPVTRFGNGFIWFVRILGFFTWAFLLFTLIKPHLRKHTANEEERRRAKLLVSRFGNSSSDYFKMYKDKLLFFSDICDAFIAYRIADGFAIVLEEPVCAGEDKVSVLAEFETYCRKIGLKPVFYRVDEGSIPRFNQLKKSKLMIGQEAILAINNFSLEGRDKKSLRNGLNSLGKKGYDVTVHHPPHSKEFLHRLKEVSDEWLESFQKNEFVFSQGMFEERELRQQDIITVRDKEGDIKAFLNIIPDYAENECTYDLIRKTSDAPPAAMDALIIRLIEYAKNRKQLYLNLGMVPMTGIVQPNNTAERIIKVAARKIKRFQHYKGLMEFKDKYATSWQNKYLVYDNDFDLLQIPMALTTVMRS